MDILKEIASINSRIMFLGKEKRHMEALMREAGVFCGRGLREESLRIRDEYESRIIENYREIRRLVIEENYMKRILWHMLADLPRKEMIDAVTYIHVEGMSINRTAELMEYSTRQIKRLLDDARSILTSFYENPAYMQSLKRVMKGKKPVNT